MPVTTASVIVCAHTEERWPVLAEAVEAVVAQSPLELLLVIDHNDGLLERARVEWPEPVRVMPNMETRGLSGARNTGVRHARGDIVVFLDDDAVPEPGWLRGHAEAYASPDVMGAGGTVTPRWATPRPGWIPEEFLWVMGCSYRGIPPGDAVVRNPIGANMSFRREVVTGVGGFASDLGRVGKTPLGCEETDLSIRAYSAFPGQTVRMVPEARVSHLVPEGRTTWRYFRSRCWSEGLSKAVMTGRVGSDDGLASERTYVTRTLPSGSPTASPTRCGGVPRACAGPGRSSRGWG
ncbi:MAG TPA: glycosyltransferase family 2 protein [Miltoncostaeaceae bacterium]|nr:glycosyltransferase family 2 protein [Miltoncostaeaceae bacterium]